jgi:3-oxoacyl-[acyl-carrier-protein] synthase III
MGASIKAISLYLPEKIVTNEQLQAENPDWDMPKIEAKVGIRSRHIAGREETASDLARIAGDRLLAASGVDRASVDFLLFCTQSPDYFPPASACVLQHRLGLNTSCAALDFNQGCSGYVYGLHLAQALINSGSARRVLLLTGETYSKFIHPRDRSVRVLFGDAGTATLIDREAGGARILPAILGTDGSGAENLIVPTGGSRQRAVSACKEVTDESGCTRTDANLFMDGQELFLFTLRRVPELVRATLQHHQLTIEDVGWFIFHQANLFMNDHLRSKIGIPREKAPLAMEDVGNTVSNTIPLAIHRLGSQFRCNDKIMLIGFGVGYSWGSCVLDWKSVHFC